MAGSLEVNGRENYWKRKKNRKVKADTNTMYDMHENMYVYIRIVWIGGGSALWLGCCDVCFFPQSPKVPAEVITIYCPLDGL